MEPQELSQHIPKSELAADIVLLDLFELSREDTPGLMNMQYAVVFGCVLRLVLFRPVFM